MSRPIAPIALVRRLLGRATVLLAAVWLAACVPTGPGGPKVDAASPVPVALLVPRTGNAGDSVLASHLENAARLAISDLSGVRIDLRVYDTGPGAAGAAAAALAAVDEGAKIILGPVFADASNAAGIAVAPRGINVLSFSNNPTIAGGNVFVLGNLFDTTARRLTTHAVRSGKRSILLVHGEGGAEGLARDAVVQAARASGASIVGDVSFELSQQGVYAAVPSIVARQRETGAQAIFFTSGTDGALPLLAQMLPEQGLGAATAQWIGLTRWDIPPSARTLPGLQGGWFAIPDPGLTRSFESRYTAAYGSPPHPIAGLAYDGIAAIGALARQGGDLGAGALTQAQGFAGVNGVFRLLRNGTNQRALAIAQIQDGQVVIIDPAPRSFGAGAGL